MASVFLLLGSNLGNREQFLTDAIGRIESEIAPVLQASSVYQTQSWGNEGQPDYLNQVVLIKVELPPADLLAKLLHIENDLGRERREKWGSRVIDLDILFYGDKIIDQPGLHIPHPRLHLRRFTLEPLAEIAPDFIHPTQKKSVLQLKNDLNDVLIVKKL
ncbi:2-amino-4-hydroxy-6-hydroxymethyldihydropteridine diphosphokinase [Mucilaginibacter hurinus]|uniref:2-amino-4-hydroxy-6-hydroxymethyldihydropteridine pyrophosphokinase n=1 Tax=Mucilaginibacter hurinus TaxID=2201324 RepID=A0A367GUE7_9SPHI|nr:2-amino-4-hydroxy-6-hydroxymethyldihydropteridine diphosphokinase [Mucilaginibacter hurinus]RCH56421.1 2-amino-4-hydroxy-6-hydroxymethyldihydropteridine diphosphokinase [Mucilaginibacter hurinus]